MNDVFAVSLVDVYFPFYWTTPMLVKRVAVETAAAYSGGTSNAYARIYAVGTDGRPGRLLYDFGLLGTAGSSLATSNVSIVSTASGNGYMLMPGIYFLDLIASYSGGSGVPGIYGTLSGISPQVLSTDEVQNYVHGMQVHDRATATSGTAGTAPDPANLTGFTVKVGSDNKAPGFCFKAN
jgi:hypothetical protein